MPKLTNTFSEIDSAIQGVVGSGLSDSSISYSIASGKQFSSPLPDNPVMIGAVGDSIVENNYATTNYGSYNLLEWVGRAWLFRVGQKLAGTAWVNIFACEGKSGRRTDQIYTDIGDGSQTFEISAGNTVPRGLLAVSPDVAFDMSGTNDLLADQSLQYMLTGKRQLWAMMLQNGIVPIVLSLLPRDDDPARAAAVPDWNAAIKSEAERMGLLYIDIYTPCANETGGWIEGYDWVNGIPDPTGLHPGSEACEVIADTIAPILKNALGNRYKTPTVYDSNNPIKSTYDPLKGGEQYNMFDTGLFPTVGSWVSAGEGSGVTTTRSVQDTETSQEGNTLVIELTSDGTSGGFAVTRGPSVPVSAGDTVGFFMRFKFTANTNKDAIRVGLQANSASGDTLFSFKSGSANGSASSSTGASLNTGDIYHEVYIPTGVTTVRPYIEFTTNEAGICYIEVAQVGLIIK